MHAYILEMAFNSLRMIWDGLGLSPEDKPVIDISNTVCIVGKIHHNALFTTIFTCGKSGLQGFPVHLLQQIVLATQLNLRVELSSKWYDGEIFLFPSHKKPGMKKFSHRVPETFDFCFCTLGP